ncbi:MULTISPECIES: FadR/GntR family transcriptional regulator [Burkholderiaceae]|jgi:GntR family transcriptional repressor for pyruvate dehydrogenase complex|uniref:GntR domain protein n=2 Tax=Burkholderiaceae TaxID=119060 RepID=B2T020_PARPJ|nr:MULTISPECIES: FCD domain-containing protein [Burkholderiaceae]UTP22267.1 FCD domain-containing protein [Burkholderia sp. FXe9]HEF5874255.1 FadR family transcriptional regulator [Burkholderia cenocepacia]ACD14581.1 GntR domain protein [Paraburkholderia phytofirmans PsJN]MBA9947222.1 FadR family transcriptional regulator [Burkholderia cepacia]MBA9977400.1 FadR family transcriptional regulator [Burkholderia cepacia]
MAARKQTTEKEPLLQPDNKGPRTTKRGDQVAELIKSWITDGKLRPGMRLNKEAELQEMFSVSRGSMREALKSLEVQGLVRLSTGPDGGATITRVPLARAFQSLQNYLFFESISLEDIYAVRRVLEPLLAAGAVEHLTDADLEALECSVEVCEPFAASHERALDQRQEDIRFHDVLARANPNAFLRLSCQIINQMLHSLVIVAGNVTRDDYQAFGRQTVVAHRAILDAARRRDTAAVESLMAAHMEEAEAQLRKVHAALRQKLVLDSDVGLRTGRKGGS